MVDDDGPDEVFSEAVISVDQIVASVYDPSGGGDGDVRINLKDAVHCLSDYCYLPLYGAAETDVFAEYAEFFRPRGTKQFNIGYRTQDVVE